MLSLIQYLIDQLIAVIPRKIIDSQKINTIQLIAHRGAHSKTITENTIAAFRAAQKLGCDGIEFDIRSTADGLLVVHHDSNLKRLWGHDLIVEQISFSKLRYLVPQIPTLAEVIAEFGKQLHLFIELKSTVQHKELVDVLKPLTAKKDYHLIALDEKILKNLAEFPKDSLLLVPTLKNIDTFCRISVTESYGGVLGHFLLMTRKRNAFIRDAKQLSGVGIVNSKNSLYRAINLGHSLIFTDKAHILSNEINKLIK